jgi:S1-C subfamily serine protease
MRLINFFILVFISVSISISATVYLLHPQIDKLKSNNEFYSNESDKTKGTFNKSKFISEYGNSVVYISSTKQSKSDKNTHDEFAHGTGFIVEYNGDKYILTNEHVIEDTDDVYVKLQDKSLNKAKVVGSDVDMDLALLKIDNTKIKNYKVFQLGDSDKVQLGDDVFAIGFPYDVGYSVTEGILSGKNKSFQIGERSYYGLLQTDTPINPGNSGGPLFNMNGEVIAINTAVTEQAQGIGFSIPANDVKKALNDFVSQGYIDRPFIGVRVMENEKGAEIVEVSPDSPAEKYGLKTGDIIIKIGDSTISSPDDLVNTIQSHKIGDKVSFSILRHNEKKTIEVKIGNKHELNSSDKK